MLPHIGVLKATRGLLASTVVILAAGTMPATAGPDALIDRPWGDLYLTEVDHTMPVRFMAPTVGRFYSMHQRAIPRTAEERARNREAAATSMDEPTPYTPTWTTLFDLSLVPTPGLPDHPPAHKIYMPSNPWKPTMRWAQFDLLEGTRHDEYRTRPPFILDGRLVAGYRPPAGFASLEQLPGGAALVPAHVAATVQLRIDDYLFFDDEGRLLGIQDGRGNGYTYEWIVDEVSTQGPTTVARREVRIAHTEGRWMRATWRQSTDRSAANTALHMTTGDMQVTVDDQSTTITYTFVPVPASDATKQAHLIARAEKLWVVDEHPGFVQQRVDEYTYSADTACIPHDPTATAGGCTDPRRPASAPHLLLTQSVRTTTLADKPVETTHVVYAYRWIGNGEHAFGRPVRWRESVPVCTTAREYKGPPPSVGTPLRAEMVRYGTTNDPAQWRHLAGRVFTREVVGARVETMEEELDPRRTTASSSGVPDLAEPAKAWHYWVESPDDTRPLLVGMTMVTKGTGLGAEPSHYHRYITYESPSPERLAAVEEVRNNNVGRQTPWQSWSALRAGGGERYVRRKAYWPDDGSPIARTPERFEEMDDSVVEATYDPTSPAINLPVRFDFAMRDKPTTHTIMLEYDDAARNPSKARGLPTTLRRAAASGESRPTDVRLEIFYAADGVLDRVEVRTGAEAEPRRVLRRNGKRLDETWRYEFDGQPRRFGRLTDYSELEGVTLVLDDLMAQTLETRPRESVRDLIRLLVLGPQT